MERLCAFANQETDDEPFLHPITRAILIHNQLAHDHPFGDGNGRTARALFLWSAMRSEYGWFPSVSISRAINRAKERYFRSFRYVQNDDGDTTYFVRVQLRCIEQEIDRLARHLEHQAAVDRWVRSHHLASASLNERQLALFEHALDHLDEEFTVKQHLQYHGVTQPTAYKDLEGMVGDGLLVFRTQGRKKLYRASNGLRAMAGDRPPELARDSRPGA